MSGEGADRSAAAVAVVPGTDPWVGRVIAGRYRVVDFMAAGGMGRIYRAEQEPLGRLVVLKVLNPRYTASGDDPEFQKRFLLEAATCAKLHHPNVVTIYDYGKVEGEDTYYMAMELIVGRTLGQVLRAEGPLPPHRVIRIARQIGRALREAHRVGIVHRDLKPSNVMLIQTDEGESVKVLDFGLVKVLRDDTEELTMEGKFLGSPKYMSPEQIRHHVVDSRSDLYSLGIIMFELLTGKVPFEGTQAVQTLMMHISLPPPSLRERGATVPLELDGVVQRCLMKEPEQRFADVDEFMTGLRIASAAVGDDAASYDPLRSSTGWGIGSSSEVLAAPRRDSLVGSTGSGPAVILQGGNQSGSDSFPTGSGVTAPRPAEIPRSGPPPVVAQPATSVRAPMIVAVAIIVAAAGLGLVLSRNWSRDDATSTTRGMTNEQHGSSTGAEPRSSGDAPTTTTPTTTTTTTPTTTAATPTTTATTPAASIVMRLRSSPEADVYEGETRVGSTPLEIQLDAATHESRTFSLRRPGYRDESLVVSPTTTSIDRNVSLRRDASAGRPSRPTRPTTTGVSTPPSTPPDRPRPNPDLEIRTSR